MPTTSTSGSGNVSINIIDVNQVVSDTIAYQSIRMDKYEVTKAAQSVQLTAYGSLQSVIKDFQTQLNKVGDAFNKVIYSTSSTHPEYATATVTDNIIGSGSHTIDVTQLAQAQSNQSTKSFTTKTGDLNIDETIVFTKTSDSSATYSLNIDATDSLEDIRDKINSQNRLGLKASIVSSTNGSTTSYNLVINSDSGTANEVGITGDTGNYFSFSQTAQAKDAIFTYDGFSQVKSKNTGITDIADGLSINLTGVGLTNISIQQDNTTQKDDIKNAIQDMLDSYNDVVSFLDGNQYVEVTQTFNTGGDSKTTLSTTILNNSFSFIKQEMQQAMGIYSADSGDIHTLADAGIVLDNTKKVVDDEYDSNRKDVPVYGSLKIDTKPQARYGAQTPLDWNLENNFNALKDFFTNPDSGLIASVNDTIDNVLLPTDKRGVIWNSTQAIESQQDITTKQIESEQKRLDSLKDQMVMQYASLNASLSSYQTLNDYLTESYAYLNSLVTGK